MGEPGDDRSGARRDDEARRARRAARARQIRRRRLTAMAVAAVVVVAAIAAISALAGRGGGDAGPGQAAAPAATGAAGTTAARAPTTTAPAGTPRVTFIGDSVSASLLYVPSSVKLLKTGLDLELDLRVCRRLVSPSCPYMGETPTTALEAIRQAGDLGTIVMIDVGYNDTSTTYAGELRQVRAALEKAGVTSVIWVTLAEEHPDYAAINEIIRAAAKEAPGTMCVADWAKVSRGQPYFGDDGLHLNTAGATALAKLLRPYALRAGRTGACRAA